MKVFSLLTILVVMFCQVGYASTYALEHNSDVVGQLQQGVATSGETLIDIARRFDIGYQEIVSANPEIDPSKQLFSGTKVSIPSRFILPNTPREGIIINLSELRLYYYPKDKNIVVTQPVGIGREGGWKTPLGVTRVTKKETNPFWYPTPNVRAEAARNGTPIPRIFPPGPDNPLGKVTLRLGWPTYLIHGTNRPEGVGARVSAGCIRMLPEDIQYLFDNTPVGTKVTVIDEPYKVGWDNDTLLFEAHPILEDARPRYEESFSQIVQLVTNKVNDSDAYIQWSTIKNLVQKGVVLPTIIGSK